MKMMYVEMAIKEKRARIVVRWSLGLRDLPIASNGNVMAGRERALDMSDREREAKVIGKEERLMLRRWAIVVV